MEEKLADRHTGGKKEGGKKGRAGEGARGGKVARNSNNWLQPLVNSSTFPKAHIPGPHVSLHTLLNDSRISVVVQSLSCIQLFATPWAIVHQAPLCMGLPKQEYRSGLPFPSSGAFPTQGSNPCLLHWQLDTLRLSHQTQECSVTKRRRKWRKWVLISWFSWCLVHSLPSQLRHARSPVPITGEKQGRSWGILADSPSPWTKSPTRSVPQFPTL